MWAWRFFLQLLKWKVQNKVTLCNFGTLAFKYGLLIKWDCGGMGVFVGDSGQTKFSH